MGKVYLRTLADCSDNGALLAIKCGACGRLIHVSPDDLIGRKVG